VADADIRIGLHLQMTANFYKTINTLDIG
jgi:hypothetical protein